MTRTNAKNARTARKPLVAGLAVALAVAGALALGAPRPAMANDGSAPCACAQQAAHFEGEKVTIQPGAGGPVYATWHQVPNGRWSAVFWTNNWTRVNAYPEAGGWSFWVNDGGESVEVTRTPTEGPAPQGSPSHWQESFGIRRY